VAAHAQGTSNVQAIGTYLSTRGEEHARQTLEAQCLTASPPGAGTTAWRVVPATWLGCCHHHWLNLIGTHLQQPVQYIGIWAVCYTARQAVLTVDGTSPLAQAQVVLKAGEQHVGGGTACSRKQPTHGCCRCDLHPDHVYKYVQSQRTPVVMTLNPSIQPTIQHVPSAHVPCHPHRDPLIIATHCDTRPDPTGAVDRTTQGHNHSLPHLPTTEAVTTTTPEGHAACQLPGCLTHSPIEQGQGPVVAEELAAVDQHLWAQVINRCQFG
jgi:hypothetical protein